jgi:hypothetical protein
MIPLFNAWWPLIGGVLLVACVVGCAWQFRQNWKS